MSEQAFINGFLKRAAEYGVDSQTAQQLVKQAVGMFPPAPPAGIEGMGSGMQQAAAMPLSAPITPAMHSNAQQIATSFNSPGQPAFPQAPAPAPTQQAPGSDFLNKFRKATGTAYNPKSRMDWENMQRVMGGAGQMGTLSRKQWGAAGGPTPGADPLV